MSDLALALRHILDPQRVLTRAIDRVAWAGDASMYHKMPRVVVRPRNLEEIRRLFAFTHERHIPMTFRTAGTSLCGQAITDGILVDVGRHFKGLVVEDDGRRVRVEPGVIAAHVNRALAPWGRKMGPDPASIDACMMGGVLANNSSGMCCGVVHNAYHTLESMTFVLPDGTVLDTSHEDAEQAFRRRSPDIAAGLLDLKRDLESDEELVQRVRRKYLIKNTTGYSLNAFLDYSRPIDIMRHLLVGSEGTLGFIAEAVLHTVPEDRHHYTALVLFADVRAACEAIAPLARAGASAIELMDRASLSTVEGQPGMPAEVAALGPAGSAILIELGAATTEGLKQKIRATEEILLGLPLASPPLLARSLADREALWKIRKGLLPHVGATRPTGTTVITEDVAFPVERLAEGMETLRSLLDRFAYRDAIIFGHARDGNLHFVMSQSFDSRAEIERYDRFMRELADLVAVRLGGSLKAEHGTGRNMAPFVELEWGDHAGRIMRALKNLVDPTNLLNPGVIINGDSGAHVEDLKSIPTVEDEVDRCMECGFCERVCPSRDLTLTPRQRISVRRWLERTAGRKGRPASRRAIDGVEREEVLRDFPYQAVETCAADGMCATACPVHIDTGHLTKRLRKQMAPEWEAHVANLAVRFFPAGAAVARGALRAGRFLQRIAGPGWVDRLRRLVGWLTRTRLPRWSPALPDPAPAVLPFTLRQGASAIYLPSCLSRVLGPPGDERMPVAQVLVMLSRRAGLPVHIPTRASSLCCGLPFASKGLATAQRRMLERTITFLWKETGRGEIPVVIDNSSCAQALVDARPFLPALSRARYDCLRFLDSISFVADVLLPRLRPEPLEERVVLHPVCSAVKMGLVEKMLAVAGQCASSVEIPDDCGCCGFAGDRGLLYPELTRAATRLEAQQVRAWPYEGFYSSNRTCEIGMQEATGRAYRSFLYLVERATRD